MCKHFELKIHARRSVALKRLIWLLFAFVTISFTLLLPAEAAYFPLQSGGNVGIGTTAPVGSLLFVGSGGTLNNVGTGDVYIQNDLEVDGTIYGNGAGITGLSASSIAYSGITAPTKIHGIDFAGYTNTWTSTLDTGVVFLIDNTDADLAADTVLMRLEYTDDGDTNAIFLQARDNNADLKFEIGNEGNVGIGMTALGGRLMSRGLGTTTGVNFQTQNSSGTPLITALDSGNVGIGTTGPTAVLNVVGSAAGDLVRIRNTNVSEYTSIDMLDSFGADRVTFGYGNSSAGSHADAAFIWTDSSTDLRFSVGNSTATPKIIFKASGNVGIGTTGPDKELHISGDSEKAIKISSASNSSELNSEFEGYRARGTIDSPTVVQDGDPIFGIWSIAYDGNSYETMGLIQFEMDGTPGDGDVPGRIEFHTTLDGTSGVPENTTPELVIKNSGNVGIGTSVPEGLLEVQGAEATNADLVLDADDGDDAADTWFVRSTAADNKLRILNDTNVRMTVQSDGNVGIGMTAPVVLLHVGSAGTLNSVGTGDVYIQNDLEVDGTIYGTVASTSTAINDLTDAFTDYATDDNLIMGRASAAALTSGAQRNLFIGESAGATTANSHADNDDNTAIGWSALKELGGAGGGFQNTAVGAYALYVNTTGSNNVALGYGTLGANTTGYDNVAVGGGLYLNTVGRDNTAIGFGALYNNVAKHESTAVGMWAMYYADNDSNPAVTYNTAIGTYALQGSATPANNTGTYNTVVGHSALAANTSGSANTAVGVLALNANTGGENNTALGKFALKVATTSDNTAIGSNSLAATTSGADNTAVGSDTLTSNVTGNKNTAMGYQALYANVDKRESTALGYWAMRYADSGAAAITYNTAVGAFALQGSATPANNTGTNNTAVGHSALIGNTTGSQNAALGVSALNSNTTGSNNIAMGLNTLSANTTGYSNVAIGTSSLQSNVAKRESTAVGFEAMRYADSTGTGAVTSNTALGAYALRGSTTAANNTGTNNTAVGHSALRLNTSGQENTAVGVTAMDVNTTGQLNTAIGFNTMFFNDTGSSNTAVGNGALTTNVAKSQSTAIGYYAMHYADNGAAATTYNTAVGYAALRGSATAANNTGTNNTVVGHSALIANTSGEYNTVVGVNALGVNTTGSYNVAVGASALYSNTGGNRNTAVGEGALFSGGNNTDDNTAIGKSALELVNGSDFNVAVGSRAGDSITSGASNILIGYGVDVPTASTSNYMSLGNLVFGVGIGATGIEISTGNVGVGTTAPEGKLEVQAVEATNADLVLDADDGDDAADTWFLRSVAGNNNLDVLNDTNVRFSIASGGNVGVGLSTPQVLLHVGTGGTLTNVGAGDAYIQNDLEVDGTIYGNGAGITGLSASNIAYSGITAPTKIHGIDFAGYTNTWTSTLDTGVVFLIDNTDADLAADTVLMRLEYTDDGDANAIFLQARDNNADLKYQIGADGVVTMVASNGDTGTLSYVTSDGFSFQGGNVGIGTTAPITTLDVSGPIFIDGDSSGSKGDLFIGGGGWPYSIGVGWSGQSSILRFNAVGTAGGTADFRDVYIYDGKTNVIAAFKGSTGNVGFGTSTPAKELHVSGDSETAIRIASASNSSGSNSEFEGYRARGTIGSPTVVQDGDPIFGIWSIAYDGNSYETMGLIQFEMDGTPGDGDMPGRIEFHTQPAGSAANPESTTPELVIKNSGNVGIGTSAPEGLLEVQGVEATDSNLVLDADDGDDAADTWFIRSTAADNKLRFLNDTNERVTIQSDGNVGIGTTVAARKLALVASAASSSMSVQNSSSSGWSGILFQNSSGSTVGGLGYGNSSAAFYQDIFYIEGTAKDIAFFTAAGSEERMRIVDASGNIGIATSTPGALLHVGSGGTINNASTGDVYIENDLEVDGTIYGNGAGISGLSAGGWTDGGAVVYQTTLTDNVGIGTSAPTSLIHANTTLSAATGDETAYQLAYTTNKATSGNDTGLLINFTDTLSPGSSRPFLLRVNGTSKFFIWEDGTFSAGGGTGSYSAYELIGGTVTMSNAQSLSFLDNASNPTGTLSLTSANNVQLVGSTVSGSHQYINQNASGSHSFYTGSSSTEKLRIANSGNVGIGLTTNNATVLLHVGTGGTVNAAGSGDVYIQNDLEVDGSIYAAGNVGIGTTAPSSLVHVKSSGTYPTLNIETDGSAAGGVLKLTSSLGSYQMYVQTGDLRFWDSADRVTIQAGGNVGIGSTAPEGLLEVQGAEATDSNLILDADDGDDAADTWFVRSTAADNKLRFLNDTNERVTIQSDGNVGIGTTAPWGAFVVERSAAEASMGATTFATNAGDASYLWFGRSRGTSASPSAVQPGDEIGGVYSGANTGSQWDDGAGIIFSVDAAVGSNDLPTRIGLFTTADGSDTLTERMTIRNSGNVGIGTSTPAEKFMVQTAVGSYGVMHTDGTVTMGTWVGTNGANAVGQFGTKSNHRLDFFTNSSSALMTILTNGNVGIGTTIPEVLFEVEGNEGTDGDIQLDADDGDDAADTWVIRSTAADNQLKFLNDTNQRMVISSGGNVGIGTSTPASKLQVNGAFNSGVATLTDAATIATDASLGNLFRVTLGDNRTLGNPTNGTDGQKVTWELIQDGSGNRTLALDTKFAFGTDITSITLSTTAGKRDFLGAIYNAGTDKWYIVSFVKGY